MKKSGKPAKTKLKVVRKAIKQAPAVKEVPARPNRLNYFVGRQESIVSTIRQLVEIESPSDNKAAVDRIAALIASKFEKLGGHAKFHKSSTHGDHLQVDFAGKRGKPVLLLGHYDTVHRDRRADG